MRLKNIPVYALLSISFFSCTKLDEKLNGRLSGEEAQSLFGGSNPDVSALLKSTYDAMRGPFQDQSRWWAAQEHTSDETLGPTRGGDWDDNGVWRVLHTHQWDANHGFLSDTYRDIGRVVFAATDLLRFNPPTGAAAEGRFLRAYASFAWLDGWDQVPYRENTGDPYEVPKVRKGTDALNYIISEIEAALPNLPDGPANKANKDAAKALLMKLYLNKGVYANRQSPAFDAADMNKVISLANEIINSNKYSLTENFFDNFAPKNDALSKENIWTLENRGGDQAGNVRFHWYSTLHYNSPIAGGGWNGFTTLSEFYDKFSPDDKRVGGDYPGVTDRSGLKVGFLLGQQYNASGEALKDRTGAPLAFTREVNLVETGKNLEVTGIRVVKYPPDFNSGDNVDNDFVIFRLADVLLMKAEALLRSNRAADALPLVNEVRKRAGIGTLNSVNLDQLLEERGRELYWEGWRRQDLIRFGKFLEPWQHKPSGNPKNLLFPIPARSLAANPNLEQNPGY